MDSNSNQPSDVTPGRRNARKGRWIALAMLALIVLALAVNWILQPENAPPAPEPADTGSIGPSGIPSGAPGAGVNPPTPHTDGQP